MIFCDAGVLLCLIDRTQPQHKGYKKLVMNLNKILITTWACLAEAMYLALHRGGWMMQRQVGQMLLGGLLIVFEPSPDDYKRLFFLMEQYQDRPMDLADATLVLAAEKLGYRQILTLDADFLFYRVNNLDFFEVLQVKL